MSRKLVYFGVGVLALVIASTPAYAGGRRGGGGRGGAAAGAFGGGAAGWRGAAPGASGTKGSWNGSYTGPRGTTVDAGTRRAAWTVGDRKSTVYEAGLANLTRDEAPLLVHFGEKRTQQWTLVRLPAPAAAQ
jgi:hypothetical protein